MVDLFVAKTKKQVKPRVSQGMGPRYTTVAERLIKERKLGRVRAFNILPGKVRFETQEVRERVILLLRQHWLTQVGWLVTALVMMLLPIT